MVEKVTSYGDAAGTTAVNQVQSTFNNFGQLAMQYQEHGGAVNTGTSPKVQYAYADGSANTVRATSMTYPNGRVLEYQYDDTAADKLSRVRTLRFDGTNVTRYAYLGLGGFVTTDYLQPQVKLNYALGSGANRYSGFDRFGRIVDLLWQNYAGGGAELVHLKYGYDRASNRTHRQDVVATSLGKNFDELYEYDGMQRLAKFHRGRLADGNTAIQSPQLQQGWVLDATGNWQNFTQSDQSDPDNTLDQQRVANRVNEITQIARTVGANWATPQYDRNGNSTLTPQPADPTLGFTLTWDAWNRLTLVQEPAPGGGWRNLATYSYDANNWRIEAKSYSAGSLSETRHCYFTNQWQNIEERLGTSPSSAPADRQFVWGLRYIDDLILRDRSISGGTLNERLYSLSDANWNVAALTDSTGVVQERYAYQAYGTPSFLNSSFTPFFASAFAWETLFDSYRFDGATGNYLARRRNYSACHGNWMSRDWIENGVNVYQYVISLPTTYTDPQGLRASVCGPRVWLYTGAWCVEQNVYDAATGAGGQYYTENAGNTHQALDRIAKVDPTGLARRTDATLKAVEGKELHDAVMKNANLQPAPRPQAPRPAAPPRPVMPAPPIAIVIPRPPVPPQQAPQQRIPEILPPQCFPNMPARPPAQNAGQQVTQWIHDYGPIVIVGGLVTEAALRKNCQKNFVECLGTALADLFGSVFGQTRCGYCRELCNRSGSAGWEAKMWNGSEWIDCKYW